MQALTRQAMGDTLDQLSKGSIKKKDFQLHYRLNYERLLRQHLSQQLAQVGPPLVSIQDDQAVQYQRITPTPSPKRERKGRNWPSVSVSQLLWLSMLLYLLVTIRQDLKVQLSAQSEKRQILYQQCLEDYQRNRCDPSTRVKALQVFCREKEHCLSEQSQALQDTLLMSNLLKDLLNQFLGGLEYKTILALAVLLLLSPVCIRRSIGL